MATLATLPLELTENVLWFLPEKDILFARAVSQAWCHIVHKSKRLQQALGLSPEPIRTVAHWNCSTPRKSARGFSDTTYKLSGPSSDEIYGHYQRDHPGMRSVVCRFNPLLAKRGKYPSSCIPGVPIIFTTVQLGRESFHFNFTRHFSKSTKDSYWKRMYLTQPPVREIEYTWNFQRKKTPEEYRAEGKYRSKRNKRGHEEKVRFVETGTLRNAAGLTMGDIMDRVKALGRRSKGHLLWHNVGRMFAVGIVAPTLEQEQQLVEPAYSPHRDDEYSSSDSEESDESSSGSETS